MDSARDLLSDRKRSRRTSRSRSQGEDGVLKLGSGGRRAGLGTSRSRFECELAAGAKAGHKLVHPGLETPAAAATSRWERPSRKTAMRGIPRTRQGAIDTLEGISNGWRFQRYLTRLTSQRP